MKRSVLFFLTIALAISGAMAQKRVFESMPELPKTVHSVYVGPELLALVNPADLGIGVLKESAKSEITMVEMLSADMFNATVALSRAVDEWLVKEKLHMLSELYDGPDRIRTYGIPCQNEPDKFSTLIVIIEEDSKEYLNGGASSVVVVAVSGKVSLSDFKIK